MESLDFSFGKKPPVSKKGEEEGLLTEKEALLYQEYASQKEGKQFSEQADKQTYQEAERLIDEIRATGIDLDKISLGSIDLSNVASIEDANQRLAGAINRIAERTNNKTITGALRETLGKRYGSSIAACTAMLVLLSSTLKKSDAAEIQQILAPKPNAEMSAREERHFNFDKFLKGFGATLYSPHYEQNPDGTFKMENLWKFLLEPAAVGLKYESRQDSQLQIHLPYKYARQFNLAEQQNPEDKEKMINYVKEKMEQELAAKFLVAFSWDEEAIKEKRPQFVQTDNFKISHIQIIGSASPEARKKGSEQPGNIDTENIALAELRAIKAQDIKEESMERISPGVIIGSGGVGGDMKEKSMLKNESVYQLEGIEDQFSPREMALLNQMAEKYETDVFGLIKMYNKNQITDQEDKNTLDESVAAKRAVIYLDDIEGGAPRVVIIPLPIFAMLAAGGGMEVYRMVREWARRRRERQLTEEESRNVAAMSGDVYEDITSNQNFYSKLAIDLSGDENINLADKDTSVTKIAERIIEEWENADMEEAARANVSIARPDYKNDQNKKLYSIFHALVVREMAQREQAVSRKSNINKIKRGMSLERQEFGKEIEEIIFQEFGYYAKAGNLQEIINRLNRQIEQNV